MLLIKENIVSFTGYRKSKMLSTRKKNFGDYLNPYSESSFFKEIAKRLDETIRELYNRGCRTFISGMSEGFDIFAAEAVLRLKKEYSDIRLELAIPFKGQDSRYSAEDKKLYSDILSSADEITYISDSYHDRAFLDRNDYMLANSYILVSYYNGLRGGTMYTVNRAERMEMEIVNLF